jgi:hypothetical protein
LADLITSDAKCTPEMKSRIAVAKVTLNKRKLFSSANWALV